MNHSIDIEIDSLTSSTSSSAVNHNADISAVPWAEALTARLESECNRWSPPNLSPNVIPKQNASIFKLGHKGDVDELRSIYAVSIGLYHRQSNHKLLFSDAEKRDVVMLAVRVFGFDFKKFFCIISPKLNEVRACYAEGSFDLDDEALSEILLFDSCFIICAVIALTAEPLYGSTWMQRMDRKEDSIRNACKRLISKSNQKAREVVTDLLMLENQVPFFVVDAIWEDCFIDCIFADYSFKDVALSCFDIIYPRRIKSRHTSQLSDCQHLLDLFHWSRVPEDRFRERVTYSQPGLYICTVTELQASSVIFKRRMSDCSVDIEFSRNFFKTKGVISIPEINLHSFSFRILSNLVAFEQAYGLRGYSFTAYVECMAQLVQSEKDVSILRSSNIIAGTPMTDKDVIDIFQTIRASVHVDEVPLDVYKLYEQVKNHVEKRSRFPSKWITISVLSVSLLLLSFLQTLYAVVGYYDPKNTH